VQQPQQLAAAQSAKRTAQAAAGAASTIATGPMGLTDEANRSMKSLIGQ
jgi:hypothetical protein